MEGEGGGEVGGECSETVDGVEFRVGGIVEEVVEGVVVAAGSHQEEEAR